MASTREWNGLILEARFECGAAGRGTGSKVHRIFSEYVVGLVPGYEPTRGTVGYLFKLSGKPVLFACRAYCGCRSNGQRMAVGLVPYNHAAVTCEKCNPSLKQ